MANRYPGIFNQRYGNTGSGGGGSGTITSVNGDTGPAVVLDTDDIPQGVTNLYFSAELAQDAVAAALTNTASINWTYNDVLNQITADVIGFIAGTIGINQVAYGVGVNTIGGSANLTYDGLLLSLSKASVSGREILAQFTISGSSNDKQFIANGSGITGTYVPSFGGYVDSTSARASVQNLGFISSANDVVPLLTDPGIVTANALITTDSSNPYNGTLSAVLNRHLFTVRTDGTNSFIVKADGSLVSKALAGTGSRMVVTDSDGVMSSQAITTGSVTSVSVVSANGFAGTVATATTTPAITISTTVTGLLKGNGTAISAAVAGTDYQAPITLTTTGTSGAATFSANILNIPNYAPGTGTVTSVDVSGGTTGLTTSGGPITTSGTITLAGTLIAVNGGTGIATYTLGDTLYSSATNTLAKLAGNITTTKKFLNQTGNGSISAAPVWSAISAGDITGSALTKTDDTNVTLTLGGSPTTALLNAASLTLGWTGLLGLVRGGTNADLSATGGAGQYLKQVSTGAAITVGTIPATDIASGAALTKTDDTNVTLTLGGTPATALLKASSLTLGWTGTLAAARLNANVVQAITNDTNVTGSISAQTLTLGWTGILAVSRGGTAVSTFGGTNRLLYTTATDTLSSITTANTSALVTNSTGVPSWTSGSTANRLLRTDGTTVSFAQVVLTTDVTGILPTSNGGTGATTTYTTGSVVFVAAGSVFAENNANFFWDNTNARLGLGQVTPLARNHITTNNIQVTLATSQGLYLSNDTAGTNAVRQQYAPPITMRSQVYGTGAGANRTADIRLSNVNAGTSDAPIGSFSIDFSNNGAAYTNLTTLSFTGAFTAAQSVSSSSASGANVFAGNMTVASVRLAVATAAGSFTTTTAASLIFGTSTTVAYGLYSNNTQAQTLSSGAGYAHTIFGGGSSNVTTNASGTHNSINTVVIKASNVTSGGATVTNGSSLYIDSAGSYATNNYALLIGAGTAGTNGDVKLLTAGNGIYVKEGTNATSGVATLVAGVAVISTTKVTANSRVQLTVQSLGTVAVPTMVGVTARVAATSFTITSASITDTSTIAWIIFEPA